MTIKELIEFCEKNNLRMRISTFYLPGNITIIFEKDIHSAYYAVDSNYLSSMSKEAMENTMGRIVEELERR